VLVGSGGKGFFRILSLGSGRWRGKFTNKVKQKSNCDTFVNKSEKGFMNALFRSYKVVKLSGMRPVSINGTDAFFRENAIRF